MKTPLCEYSLAEETARVTVQNGHRYMYLALHADALLLTERNLLSWPASPEASQKRTLQLKGQGLMQIQ